MLGNIHHNYIFIAKHCEGEQVL